MKTRSDMTAITARLLAQGKGEVIDFIATDIHRIVNGRIAENWHLEDNLTLLQQLGLVAK